MDREEEDEGVWFTKKARINSVLLLIRASWFLLDKAKSAKYPT
jgi:hypothetical protein